MTLFLVSFSGLDAQAQRYPVGKVVEVSNSRCSIAGWATDPDMPAPADVVIYRDGAFNEGGIPIGSQKADGSRLSSPPEAIGHSFAHRFDFTSGLYDGKVHRLYVYAIDLTGDSSAPLAASPATITCPAARRGSYPIGTVLRANSNRCSVEGWTRDPDTIATTTIHVYVDGPWWSGKVAGQAKADRYMPVLPTREQGYGFRYEFGPESPLADGREHEVYVYGIDLTGDMNAPLAWSPVKLSCVKPTVNVRDFGARGDGSSDDAPAVQAAIDSIPQVGGTVTFPPGLFMLGRSAGMVMGFQSALLVRTGGVLLKGMRGDTEAASSVLKLKDNVKMRVLSITKPYVAIDGLVIDGNKTGRDQADGYPNGDVVDGLVFTDSTAHHVTVRNCEVRNSLEDGIGFWLSDDALVENCHVHDLGTAVAGASGISLSGGARARAIGNTSERNSYGAWAAFGSRDVTIKYNIFKNNFRTAIVIGGLTPFNGYSPNNRGFAIGCNVITGNGAGYGAEGGWAAVGVGSASDGIITGNYLIGNSYEGVSFANVVSDDPALATVPSTGWRVEGNKFSNMAAFSPALFGMGEVQASGGSRVGSQKNIFCLHFGTNAYRSGTEAQITLGEADTLTTRQACPSDNLFRPLCD